MNRKAPIHLLRAMAVAISVGVCGCESIPKVDGAKSGPFFTPANARGIERMPAGIRRIAILPVAGVSAVSEESLARLDTAFNAELNRAARAETVPVSRDALARLGGARQVDSTIALPPHFLAKIQGETAADAVLFVDVTTHSAYPPLALGIRGRLVSLDDGSLLWAFDNVFDAQDQAVANAARRHYLMDPYAHGHVTDMSSTVLQNPSRFASYVAAATFATLPIR